MFNCKYNLNHTENTNHKEEREEFVGKREYVLLLASLKVNYVLTKHFTLPDASRRSVVGDVHGFVHHFIPSLSVNLLQHVLKQLHHITKLKTKVHKPCVSNASAI